ncbi:helix-turn-helix domain-containing protein [Chitinophaga polysaccharea]|uniref:helix-turn-helix domain-containing protein n=1 Tax=Chitinophaga polysaccharea TaxID=1293035 RepID=UPI00115C0651|nr:helix-turn-helix domain-containing protein [Chitinophaga polysaccharea]
MIAKQVLQIDHLEGSTVIKLFDSLNKRLDELVTSPNSEQETFLTRQEVADLFKISLPTVHAWMNAGILKPYKIANKTRFLRSEVLASVKDISVKGGSHA